MQSLLASSDVSAEQRRGDSFDVSVRRLSHGQQVGFCLRLAAEWCYCSLAGVSQLILIGGIAGDSFIHWNKTNDSKTWRKKAAIEQLPFLVWEVRETWADVCLVLQLEFKSDKCNLLRLSLFFIWIFTWLLCCLLTTSWCIPHYKNSSDASLATSHAQTKFTGL